MLGRGPVYCEMLTASDGWLFEPLNTWTNLAPIAAGLLRAGINRWAARMAVVRASPSMGPGQALRAFRQHSSHLVPVVRRLLDVGLEAS